MVKKFRELYTLPEIIIGFLVFLILSFGLNTLGKETNENKTANFVPASGQTFVVSEEAVLDGNLKEINIK